MADTFTTNLVLTKPEIGASTDTWGAKLNANSDTIANMFSAGPALKVANGGTGATTATNARANLGLGTMATQNANDVFITGGSATFVGLTVTGTEPTKWFYEPDAATNEKYWRLVTSDGMFFIQTWDDVKTTGASPVVIDRTGTTATSIGLTATTVTINGSTVYHAGNIATASINESQVADGAIFPRLGATETVTGQWNFTTVPQKTSGGKFLHYASSTYSGGAVTVSTSDPTGIPANGDRWVKYV